MVRAECAGDAEVRQRDMVVFVDEDVVGLDVAVDDAPFVEALQRDKLPRVQYLTWTALPWGRFTSSAHQRRAWCTGTVPWRFIHFMRSPCG